MSVIALCVTKRLRPHGVWSCEVEKTKLKPPERQQRSPDPEHLEL